MNNLKYTQPSLSNKLSDFKTIDDLSDGWKSIVNGKELYLPKEPSETKDSYDYRHDKALYNDFFNPAINGLSGLIFKNPIVYGEDIPSQLQPMIENADNMGNHFDVLIEKMFDEALRKGVSFVLIDIPKTDNVKNKADEIKQNIRPYLINYKPENVTSWKTETINGQVVLSQVKLREFIEVDDLENPFATDIVEQYRVLYIGRYEVYQIDKDKNEILIDAGTTNLNYIPLVCLNLEDDGLFESKIPFYDLGQLNIAHYQISTDSRHSAHTASVPFYFGKGIDPDEVKGFKISPNTFFATHSQEADIKIIDYDGKGVAVNQSILEDIETRIKDIALSIMSSDGNTTATEVNIANTKNQSKLNKWVRKLTDTVELILQHSAGFYGLDGGGSIAIDADIISQPLDSQDIIALNNVVSSGNMSLDTMYQIIGSGKLTLPEDFEVEVEQERINQDGMLIGNDRTEVN